MSRTDSLYFSGTTFSTVGYGHITAKSQAARVVVIVQILADMVILGFGVKVSFAAVPMVGQRRPWECGRHRFSPESEMNR